MTSQTIAANFVTLDFFGARRSVSLLCLPMKLPYMLSAVLLFAVLAAGIETSPSHLDSDEEDPIPPVSLYFKIVSFCNYVRSTEIRYIGRV